MYEVDRVNNVSRTDLMSFMLMIWAFFSREVRKRFVRIHVRFAVKFRFFRCCRIRVDVFMVLMLLIAVDIAAMVMIFGWRRTEFQMRIGESHPTDMRGIQKLLELIFLQFRRGVLTSLTHSSYSAEVMARASNSIWAKPSPLKFALRPIIEPGTSATMFSLVIMSLIAYFCP